MTKTRLEAFSDGVLAILITIMVLEMDVPHQADLAALRPVFPVFLSYLLSFLYLGIYWNNHHHLLQASRHVSGSVLWANLHLLFWLSLVPFVTGWMGQNRFASRPVMLYGGILLMAAIAYYILTLRLVAANGESSPVAVALGRDRKGKLSIAAYVLGILLAIGSPLAASGVYLAVAILWLVPDRRMERALAAARETGSRDDQ